MSLVSGDRTKRIGGAMLGGLVGTVVMAIVFALLEVETRYQAGIFAAIARYVGMPGDYFLGFLVFVVFGVVVWPLVFVVIEEYLPRGPDPGERGIVFAGLLWVLFFVVARGDVNGPVLLIYGSLTFVGHLVYGFTLGAVYGHFRPDFSLSDVRESHKV